MSEDFVIFREEFNDENVVTRTSCDNIDTERRIKEEILDVKEIRKLNLAMYLKGKINRPIEYMKDQIFEPWNPFYTLLPIITCGLENEFDMEEFRKNTIQYLKNHLNDHCGWSGYLHDYPGMVPMYGMAIFLGLFESEELYEMVDQKAFYEYVMSCKNPDGSFSAIPNGETDLRSTFSALFISWMYNIITPELSAGLVDFVVKCQTYEGGFGPVPNCEAHGGYTYCAIGILHILNRLDAININKVVRYIADCQVPFSGGFAGRTNKLADTCYSWWIGSPARTLSNYLKIGPFWNDRAMSEFLVKVSQYQFGGLRDRPSNKSDSFHTLFGCAGICVSANHDVFNLNNTPEVDSISSIPLSKFNKMKEYFSHKPFTP
ncbi:Prenyltransferase and squalene oxidase repeat family protein [Trichomonas vaginalis G3]|uniref:Prenyltransferase and squalene oxidase repeat family protein n=1 Tax=Trichomonas vaginalis (strain ATCC PRA-98 / G3) TaxID=412133 RepID=A2E265_TRIV3|nr:protein farnesylation [Trichomonas vaginalis G3]EAY13279.1 Prenyltransferase and squalene oxidase repeat family protein [Trichomonas vaginalis G3]KAI5494066.1 protein farnesylation [Trichomonas vaginalis G3]|eukprot:XP_001325502.1 Prenyltransferase and squalene oxidase repeat family protein [Trichomonas vaginalis G3]